MTASGGLRSRLAAALRPAAVIGLFDRIAPRRQDVLPALAIALVGLLPLLAFRFHVLRTEVEGAGLLELWRLSHRETESWALVAGAVALLLRPLRGRGHRTGRVVFHGVATLLLVLTGLEIAFFDLMGSRVDLAALEYLATDPQEVGPVVLAEVRTWHMVAAGLALVFGLLPALPRIRPSSSPWWGRLALLFLVPSFAIHVVSNPRMPAKGVRALEEPLIPLLWGSLMDRLADVPAPIPPPAPRLEIGPPTRESLPNVVFVLLESTGAHSTSLYPPYPPTTPNLAALAPAGLLVDRAFSVVPHTSKALVPILCGQYPELDAPVREARWGGLPGRCLPDLLGEAGYRTAFFQAARGTYENRVHLVHEMGFDTFRAMADIQRKPYTKEMNSLGIEDQAMLGPGVAWSLAEPGPFFATYLTIVSHGDYGTPEDFDLLPFPKARSKNHRAYLNSVRYVDRFMGDLVRAYEERGHGDDTLFVILGDHGEGFGEHGRSYHDLVIWEEGLRIPMLLYGPGVLGGRTGRIEGNRQVIDLLPTVLDALGIPLTQGSLPGTSLLGPVDEDRVLYHSCWRSFRCLARRQGDRKFIDHYRELDPQIFNLAKDPGEHRDLAHRADDDRVVALRDEVRRWRAEVNAAYEGRRQAFVASLQAPDASPAVASWGGKVEMLDCAVEKDAVVPGESVWVHCRWRVPAPLEAHWRVRAQLVGAGWTEERISEPADGLLPTWKWEPGHAVSDRFRVPVPPKTAAGEAVLQVGWTDRAGQAVMMDAEHPAALRDVTRIRILPPPPMDLPPVVPEPAGE